MVNKLVNFLKVKYGFLSIIFLIILFISCFAYCDKALALVDSATLTAYVMPINNFLWGLLTSLLKWAVYLMMSAYALQTTLSNPQWIDINSTFVQTGLNITTTMADILLIVVFIAIAMGHVFNIDKLNNQKIITKFFIAALLVHFGPLFVGMIIDVSNIANSSVMVGNENIIMNTCKEFAGQLVGSAWALLQNYVLLTAAAAVPILSLAVVGKAILDFLGGDGWILTQLPLYLVQIMVAEILAGLMFSYAVFFLTRVFMMEILAVFSPLAILASVLPSTQNIFSTWLKWLVGWSIAGIMTLFLLTLGLNTIKTMIPTISDSYTNLNGTYGISLRQDTMYWLMICVYMLTVDMIVAGSIPSVSGKISDKIKGGLSPVSKIAGKEGGNIRGSFEKGMGLEQKDETKNVKIVD